MNSLNRLFIKENVTLLAVEAIGPHLFDPPIQSPLYTVLF